MAADFSSEIIMTNIHCSLFLWSQSTDKPLPVFFWQVAEDFFFFFKLGEFHAGLEKKEKKLGMEIGNKGVKGGGLDCVLRKAVPAPHCS